jgi:hypothetical protein
MHINSDNLKTGISLTTVRRWVSDIHRAPPRHQLRQTPGAFEVDIGRCCTSEAAIDPAS